MTKSTICFIRVYFSSLIGTILYFVSCCIPKGPSIPKTDIAMQKSTLNYIHAKIFIRIGDISLKVSCCTPKGPPNNKTDVTMEKSMLNYICSQIFIRIGEFWQKVSCCIPMGPPNWKTDSAIGIGTSNYPLSQKSSTELKILFAAFKGQGTTWRPWKCVHLAQHVLLHRIHDAESPNSLFASSTPLRYFHGTTIGTVAESMSSYISVPIFIPVGLQIPPIPDCFIFLPPGGTAMALWSFHTIFMTILLYHLHHRWRCNVLKTIFKISIPFGH